MMDEIHEQYDTITGKMAAEHDVVVGVRRNGHGIAFHRAGKRLAPLFGDVGTAVAKLGNKGRLVDGLRQVGGAEVDHVPVVAASPDEGVSVVPSVVFANPVHHQFVDLNVTAQWAEGEEE